jgi:aspartyl/asparaginyl beta-hydroxylase (cupin superfamily)
VNETDAAAFNAIIACEAELESRPFVRRGLEVLGVNRVRRAQGARKPSEYAHPLQRPYYYVPGVPARMFYDPSDFSWAEQLQRAFSVIKRELDALLQEGGNGFSFYRGEDGTRVTFWQHYQLFIAGKKIDANCERVPETIK